jgi:hypothetical protein
MNSLVRWHILPIPTFITSDPSISSTSSSLTNLYFPSVFVCNINQVSILVNLHFRPNVFENLRAKFLGIHGMYYTRAIKTQGQLVSGDAVVPGEAEPDGEPGLRPEDDRPTVPAIHPCRRQGLAQLNKVSCFFFLFFFDE